jgi:hypothetical protein
VRISANARSPLIPAALTQLPNRSRRICASMVGPAQTAVPWGCAFSGEIDGQVTSTCASALRRACRGRTRPRP